MVGHNAEKFIHAPIVYQQAYTYRKIALFAIWQKAILREQWVFPPESPL